MLKFSQMHRDLNLLPAWRAMGLNRIWQLRNSIRQGRYTIDYQNIIKKEQKHLAATRKRVNAWKVTN